MLSTINLFDSHAHLDDDKFNEDFEEVIEQITSSCIKYVVDVGASLESSAQAVEIAKKVPFVYAAVGLHPCDAEQCTEEGMQKIRELAKHEKVVAIGESGLDYYWDDCPRDVQKMSFIKHIELANELDLPLIVHNRDAHGVDERAADIILGLPQILIGFDRQLLGEEAISIHSNGRLGRNRNDEDEQHRQERDQRQDDEKQREAYIGERLEGVEASQAVARGTQGRLRSDSRHGISSFPAMSSVIRTSRFPDRSS